MAQHEDARPRDAQEEHEDSLSRMAANPPSAAQLAELMSSAPRNGDASSPSASLDNFDPIASAMQRHGLTREEAERMAEEFGF